jgi:3-oxoacyl-(acyl-carrier-protein) synthase
MSRRVVVTGLGMVTSLGADVTSTWAGVLRAKVVFLTSTILMPRNIKHVLRV